MAQKNKLILLSVISSLTLGCFSTSSIMAKETSTVAPLTQQKEDGDSETDIPLPTVGELVKESDELEKKYEIDENQLNQIAMLNYMSFLAEEIRKSDAGKMYFDRVIDILVDNLNPSSIDSVTKERINRMIDDIEDLSMLDVKRERLAYIYEQNQAAAIRNAVPSPMSILTTVQAGNTVKSAIAMLGLVLNSAASYSSAKSQANLQNLQSGWELDDKEQETIDGLRTDSFNYMIDMANKYGIDDKITMNESAIKEFVKWQNSDSIKGKIQFLTSNSEKYEMYGNYWLLLASSYYEDSNFEKCIESIDKYLAIKPGIFRIDIQLAETLPKVIAALPNVYKGKELADKELYYVNELYKNTKNDDYILRYIAALTYMDLYSMTKDCEMLETAYEIIKNNVNNYCSNQGVLNKEYLAEVVEAKELDGMTKKQKKEVKEYNKSLKEMRKTELPPVDEVLFMNATLMLELADELSINESEKELINGILHNNDKNLFLVDSIDSHLWYGETKESLEPFDLLSVSNVDGLVISIPANYVCDSSVIKVTVNSGKKETVIDDWKVDSVKRKKNCSISDIKVNYESESTVSNILKTRDLLKDGDTITVDLYPYEDYFEPITTTYKVSKGKATLKIEME